MRTMTELYASFRKRTFPPSVDDIEWRYASIVQQIDLLGKQFDALGEQIKNTQQASLATAHVIYNLSPWRLLLDTASLVDRTIIAEGSWEVEQMNYLLSALQFFGEPSQNVFLDIGSYFGLYSLKAVETSGFSEIHAFEADRHTIGQLYGNIFLNGLEDRIVVHNLAVSDHKGEVIFRDSRSIPDNRGASGVLDEQLSGSFKAPCDKLDNLFSFRGKNIVMKLDVEGHEEAVLNGMENILRHNKIVVQAEAFGPTRERLFAAMERFGFNYTKSILVDHYFRNFA